MKKRLLSLLIVLFAVLMPTKLWLQVATEAYT